MAIVLFVVVVVVVVDNIFFIYWIPRRLSPPLFVVPPCCLCSFQPFKNNIVFWVSEIAFVMTSIKYVVAMLRLSVPEDNTNVEARTEAVGTFLIVADLTTFVMFFVGGVLCVMWLNNTWSNSKDDDGTQDKKNKVKVAPASLNAPRQPKLASVISYNHDKLKAIVINDQVIKFEKSHGACPAFAMTAY